MVCVRPGVVVDDVAGFKEIILCDFSDFFFEFFFRILEIFFRKEGVQSMCFPEGLDIDNARWWRRRSTTLQFSTIYNIWVPLL